MLSATERPPGGVVQRPERAAGEGDRRTLDPPHELLPLEQEPGLSTGITAEEQAEMEVGGDGVPLPHGRDSGALRHAAPRTTRPNSSSEIPNTCASRASAADVGILRPTSYEEIVV